jgi:hypothetical protein
MRSCYESAIIDRVAARLVPARPTVVCRSTPVLKSTTRACETGSQSKLHTLCLKVARLLFRSSRSKTNALRVTSLHAAIVESNVMFGYCVVRGCVCRSPDTYAEPSPSVQTGIWTCQHLTTFAIQISQWRREMLYSVTQLTRRLSSDRQHLLHSLAQAV